MQGYNPAPAPQGSAQQHANVAQHLAMNIPGFGNPAGIKFRGAVHATTAFSAPQHSQTGGGAPAAYATPAYAAPAYAAPAYGAPVYGATATLAAVPSTYASGGAPIAATVATVVSTAPPGYAGGAAPLGAPPAQAPAYPSQAGDAVGAAAAAPAMETPADFTCPITQEIMTDPVICADGHSYERDAIARWLASHQTSPKTNARLEHTTLIPNHTLRGAISQFGEDQRKMGGGSTA